ncbi:MAG: hypothetical protein WBD55_12295 [Dehalococcoidia bacterium]|jgi:hypothetical protein
MPFDPDATFLPADFLEFIAVFITMGIAFVILVALGYWWQH